MPVDEKLVARVREAMAGRPGLGEKRMFGGVCFLIHGNMACGITGELLMVRVGRDDFDAALARPHARPMDFTGRPSRGMVYVDAPGIKTKRQLAAWVARGADFAASLPPK